MYLGIDGGGTKTRAVIADRQGRIIADCIVGSMNPNGFALGSVEAESHKLIEGLSRQCPLENVQAAFAGMAGVDHPEDNKVISEILGKVLPLGLPLKIANDAMIALSSETFGDEGIVLIAGTGSIAYARLKDGKAIRVGGWGYLIGDEGSGYAMGRRALIAVMQAYDGRGKSTTLTDKILSKADCPTANDLIPFLYSMASPKKWIASCSREVFMAYIGQDRVAQTIVEQAVGEQKEQIDALLLKMGNRSAHIKVVLTGGLFQNTGDILISHLQALYEREGKNDLARACVVPTLPPVAGAVIEAMRLNNINIKRSARDEFKARWQMSENITML